MHLSRNCPFSNKANLHLELPGTFCPLTIWTISLEFYRKPSILAADDFLGACYRNAMTPKSYGLHFFSNQGPPNGGVSNGGVSRSGLVLPDFAGFSVIFPICSGMVQGFSRFVLFLFLGLLRAPTRNSPERVRNTIWTLPKKVGNPPGWKRPGLASLKITRSEGMCTGQRETKWGETQGRGKRKPYHKAPPQNSFGPPHL